MVRLGVLIVLVVLVSACLVAGVTNNRRRRTRTRGCRGLARYNVTFVGLWSRVDFPKQYPLQRPHAQWTKVLGRTHNNRYNIFKVGGLATEALKQFSQLGTTNILDREAQGLGGIFDSFALPALNTDGVGSTSSRIVLDAKHPKVSMVARIVPSPDWFVGIDSHPLCGTSGWLASDSIDLYPYDAGTDMGYTFTAPNWPENPQKPIVQITSQKPSHPANSFYYPDLPELPPLARLEFRKVAMYDVREILEEEVEDEIEEDSGDTIVAVPAPTPAPTPAPRRWQSKSRSRSRQWWRQRQQQNRKQLANGSQEDDDDVDSAEAELDDAASLAGVQDCMVGEWSEWGVCSKTCGFGKRMRMRRVTQRPSSNGRPCPPLLEDELCGSMRNCGWNHFTKFDSLRRGSK